MSTGGAEGYFEFFREELIPDGLQLVLDVWRKLPSSTKAGKEDEITGRLAAAMKRPPSSPESWISCNMVITAWLAPPCKGPHRAQTPAAALANRLASLEATIRTVEVEQFCS